MKLIKTNLRFNGNPNKSGEQQESSDCTSY